MFIDASALVAIIATEPDGPALHRKFGSGERRLTSAIAIYEATLAIERIKNFDLQLSLGLVTEYVEASRTVVVPITDAETWAALEAFARYGKGRHPAGLNMGDCFAYACARTNGVPLLYKGGDFAQTDIATA